MFCMEKDYLHNTPTLKPHPNRKIWWRAIMVWGCFASLGPGQIAVIAWKKEFPSLSRHFAGKLKTICPPTEIQQRDNRPMTQIDPNRSESTTEGL